jgi:hypothetical protein
MTKQESTSSACATNCCSAAEPIVCTLTGGQSRAERVAEFQAVFEFLECTELLEDGFRWHFLVDVQQEAWLRDLARRENECCRFFEFTLARDGANVVWETRAPQEAAEVLVAFRRLPETLKGSPPHDALESAFADAGLKFVTDGAGEGSS